MMGTLDERHIDKPINGWLVGECLHMPVSSSQSFITGCSCWRASDISTCRLIIVFLSVDYQLDIEYIMKLIILLLRLRCDSYP